MTRLLVCSAAMLTPEGWVKNVGDEALTEVLADALRRRGAAVLATLNAPGDAPLPAGRVRVSPRTLAAAVRSADGVVVGGGTLLQQDDVPGGRLPVPTGMPRYILAIAAAARLRGRPVAVGFVGAERLDGTWARTAVRAICSGAAAVSTRDPASADLVARTTGVRPRLGADAMFLAPAPDVRPPLLPAREIAVSLRGDASDALLDALAGALAIRRPGRVLLVPMERGSGQDPERLAALAARLAGIPCETVPPEAPWREVLARIAGADACIGMRLHFLIFAALARRPAVAIDAGPKVASFAAETGICACPPGAGVAALSAALAIARPPEPDAVAAMRRRAEAALDDLAAGLLPAPAAPPRRDRAGRPLASVR